MQILSQRHLKAEEKLTCLIKSETRFVKIPNFSVQIMSNFITVLNKWSAILEMSNLSLLLLDFICIFVKMFRVVTLDKASVKAII